jgi:hypothetical protein
MKKVTIEFTDEEFKNYEAAAAHYKDLGIPLTPETIINFTLSSVKNKPLDKIVNATNAHIKSLTSTPKKKASEK